MMQNIPVKPWEFIDAMTIYKLDLDMSNVNISKNYNPYMINRWLSSIEIFIPIINEINIHGDCFSKQSHYNFLKGVLPKQKVMIDYQSVKMHKNLDNIEIKYIADYFQVGVKEAKLYINMLSNVDIKKILDKYKYGINGMIEI